LKTLEGNISSREQPDVRKPASVAPTLPWLVPALEWEFSPLLERSFDYVLSKYSKSCT
jgi:hypothetical protein